MTEQETAVREVAKGAGRLAVHLFALVAGLLLMFLGVAMGVSVVLLPVGVPVGLVGLFVFMWGFWTEPDHPASGEKEA